jgi:hypothetical protein
VRAVPRDRAAIPQSAQVLLAVATKSLVNCLARDLCFGRRVRGRPPSSRTRRTRRCLPAGVNFALACDMRGLLLDWLSRNTHPTKETPLCQ